MVPAPRASRALRSAAVRLRQGGLRSFWEALSLLLFCRRRLSVFAIDLSDGYAPPPLDPRVEIRPARPEDLALFRATPERHRNEFYRDRIDGAESWVAFWEGRPAHIAWIYDNTLATPFLRLGPLEAELRFAYTLPEFRNRGLYAATNAAMAAELRRRGYRRAYGLVADHGAAFRLGLELALQRVGFRRIRTLPYVRLLGVQLRPHLSL